MSVKKKLDFKRPYARVMSVNPKIKHAYTQDGLQFDGNGVECGKVPGYEEAQAKAAEAAAAKKEAKRKREAAAQAESILGDLGDPNADAVRENAAAAQAEDNADEA